MAGFRSQAHQIFGTNGDSINHAANVGRDQILNDFIKGITGQTTLAQALTKIQNDTASAVSSIHSIAGSAASAESALQVSINADIIAKSFSFRGPMHGALSTEQYRIRILNVDHGHALDFKLYL